MNQDQVNQLHQNYSDLHDELQENSRAKGALKNLVNQQSEILQRARQHLNVAKQSSPNIDLSGFETELTNLGHQNAVLATIDGPKMKPSDFPAPLNHPEWPQATITQGDQNAQRLQAENPESPASQSKAQLEEQTAGQVH